MKFIFSLLLLVTAYSVSAQMQGRFAQESSELMTDALGQPIYTQQKFNWEGQVFFPNDYTYSTITVPSGKKYRNIKSKINLMDGSLLFTDSSGTEYILVLPIKKIEFEDILNQSVITFIKIAEDTANALYQRLDSGKVSLLKRISLTYKDQMGYGSTTVTRIFEQRSSYFTYSNVLLPLDRSKSSITKLLADKSQEVETFIESEKIKPRKEEDLIKVFQFYNSIK